MDHWPEFMRNVYANLASNLITWALCGIGGLLIALLVLLTEGLKWWQEGAIVLLFSFVIIGLVVATYIGQQYKRRLENLQIVNGNNSPKALSTQPPVIDPLQLQIRSAMWGNDVSKNPVRDAIDAKARNALMFFVNQDAFPLPDPAWGDDNKYVEVTYSYSGSGERTVKRKQGSWIVIPEDPEASKKIERLMAIVAKFRNGLEEMKTAGECEQLAWQADILRQKLLAIVQQLNLENNEEALAKLKYPLFGGFPSPDEPHLWKWYHRSMKEFLYFYEIHRKRTMMLSLKDFESVVTLHPLGSNYPGSDRVTLSEGLEEHRKALLSAAERLKKSYVESADSTLLRT